MNTIRCIYQRHPVTKDPEPNFPATDQHPEAERFYVWKDGSITKPVAESKAEKETIDAIAEDAKTLGERAGEETRRAEAIQVACQEATLVVSDFGVQLEAHVKLADAATAESVKLAAAAAESPLEDEDLKTIAEESANGAAALQATGLAMADVHATATSERDMLEKQAASAMDNAQRLAGEHGLQDALVMNDEQRRFLGRIRDADQRTSFIAAKRSERRKLIEKAELPVMVVDAIGEPTMEEINAVLNAGKVAAAV